MPENDPFESLEDMLRRSGEAPNEDEQHQQNLNAVPFTETTGENGEVRIEIHPTFNARMLAATIGGQFLALLQARDDKGVPVFNRDEAMRIILKTMTPVVIHAMGDDDEDDE